MYSFVSRFSLCLILFLVIGELTRGATYPPEEPVGITFFKGSWNEVLAEAKRQNKPVFLDIFATWCPPCKRMAREAFPNPKVGVKFNVHFINYQLDAEKGDGMLIARRYAVSSYPTGLYLTPNGDLIHRSVGYGGVNAMIDQADHILALPQFRSTLAKGDKDYANGRRDAAFLKKYLATRQSLARPTYDVLDNYLDALPEPERSTNETLSFVISAIQSSNTKAFQYLLNSRPTLNSVEPMKQNLSTALSEAIQQTLTNDFERACTSHDEVLLEKIIVNSEQNLVSIDPQANRSDAQKQAAANDYRLKFYQRTNNSAKYQTLLDSLSQP